MTLLITANVDGVERKSLFLHVPKTGGSAIKNFILNEDLGINAREVVVDPRSQHYHPLPEVIREEWSYSFAFVRHPLSWLESWWKFQSGIWAKHGNKVWWPVWDLERCGDDDFGNFIDNYLRECPGFVTRLYEWYFGPEGLKKVTRIFRYENLAVNLHEALNSCGIPISLERVEQMKKKNVSQARAGQPDWRLWPRDQRKAVLCSEIATIRRFYPEHLDYINRNPWDGRVKSE